VQSWPTPPRTKLYNGREQFAEHLTQFGLGRDAINNLERNIDGVARSVIEAASGRRRQGDALLTDGGLKWNRCVDLFDNICVCHRPTDAGVEFAVVERWGLKPSERCEVLVQGGDALELLRAFIANQLEVLRLWIGDVAAPVNEKLAEKYPGEDLTRVTDALVNRLTQMESHIHTIKASDQPKHTRGIRI
jgi:hypothetical protein